MPCMAASHPTVAKLDRLDDALQLFSGPWLSTRIIRRSVTSWASIEIMAQEPKDGLGDDQASGSIPWKSDRGDPAARFQRR